MKLVKLLDMVGKPAFKADLRSRNADGSVMYEHQAKERIGTIDEVVIRKAGPCCGIGAGPKVDWLYWYSQDFDSPCKVSGHRLDAELQDPTYLLAEVNP